MKITVKSELQIPLHNIPYSYHHSSIMVEEDYAPENMEEMRHILQSMLDACVFKHREQASALIKKRNGSESQSSPSIPQTPSAPAPATSRPQSAKAPAPPPVVQPRHEFNPAPAVHNDAPSVSVSIPDRGDVHAIAHILIHAAPFFSNEKTRAYIQSLADGYVRHENLTENQIASLYEPRFGKPAPIQQCVDILKNTPEAAASLNQSEQYYPDSDLPF